MKLPWSKAKPAAAATMAGSGTAQNFSISITDVPWLNNSNGSWASASSWAGRDQALSVPAVLKGRNLICGTIGSLPFVTVDSNNNQLHLPLFDQIDPNVPNSVTIAMTIEDLLFYSLSWWHILQRGFDGYPTKAEHVFYNDVTWQMPPGYPLDKLPSGYFVGSHAFVLGEPVPATDLIRFDSPNPPLLLSGGRAIMRALKLEQAADLLSNDPQAREYFTAVDGAEPEDDDVRDMLDGWLAARQQRSTAYIPSAFTLNQIQQPTPADLQLAQIQREATLALANAMGLDPEDLGVSTTTRTYRNAVDRRQDRINECYAPYVQALEDRLSMGDVTRRGQRVVFQWDDFLKANPLERAQTQQIYLQGGVVLPEEVRVQEDMPPLTAAQKRQVAKPQNAPQTAPGRPQTAPQSPEVSQYANAMNNDGGPPVLTFAADVDNSPWDASRAWHNGAQSDDPAKFYAGICAGRKSGDPSTQDGWALPYRYTPSSPPNAGAVRDALSRLPQTDGLTNKAEAEAHLKRLMGQINPNYEADPSGLVFDCNDIAEAFSVDEVKRTITGMVVPWGKVGRSGGRKWRFTPGSLKYAKSAINRIKLLEDHDSTQAVGFCARTWADELGQWATYKVARGEAGDRALALAADGVKDGLSVGIGFEGDNASFIHSPDADDGSINVVTSAPWRETSLVALPAFDGARVSAVAMSSATEGDAMSDMHEAAQEAPVAAQFDAEAIANAVKDAVAAEFAARETKEGPTPVNPMPKVATVNEQPLYRFDGGNAQRVFTADMAKAANGDYEAKSTLEKYMGENMAAQFANITPANVAALNPVPTRAELYVPHLNFPRPLGDMVTTGGLTDLIAFYVPKWSSSSGLVGDHTTGTEPTDGAFAATTQTVTPKGLSGRVDLDRELIDSGGSPQADMVIYQDMVRAYNEQLEKRIVAAFVAASISDTTLHWTSDAAGQTALLNTLSALQFLRGGDRFTSLALDSTLYNPIIQAKDADSRPLFPMVNPVNSSGTTASDLSNVRIGGHVGVPAWACETGNGGAQKSYLFVPGSVYQWNSAPQRFTFNQVNVSSVGIAIWGYSAEAITRTSDVYQLVYSAT